MMSKRIHELAKDWGVQPKDVLAAAEQLGMKGKRSQSAITDEETARLRQALGLSPRAAQVTLGTERVVAERLVTQRELGVDRLVTAREQTTETRLQANVIRRRTAREVVKREELPGVPDGDVASVPPSLDFDDSIPPSLDVPPCANSTLAGPRSAALADSTLSVIPIRRTRSRSASHLFGFVASGHHGPSVSCALVSLTSVLAPLPEPSAARRAT